jgi:hypothetical protein
MMDVIFIFFPFNCGRPGQNVNSALSPAEGLFADGIDRSHFRSFKGTMPQNCLRPHGFNECRTSVVFPLKQLIVIVPLSFSHEFRRRCIIVIPDSNARAAVNLPVSAAIYAASMR